MGFGTWDIEGAQAGTWRRKRPKKTAAEFTSLNVLDIEGASPSRLIPRNPNRTLDFTLTCGDISGATPAKRVQRSVAVDPNERNYGMPVPAFVPDEPPKQLREVPNCADIVTYIKKHLYARDKNPLDCSDIEGSAPAPPRAHRPTEDKVIRNYVRQTQNRRIPHNPLSPRYIYDVPKCVKEQGREAVTDWATKGAGNCNADPGFRPKRLPGERKDRPMFSLSLTEIDKSHPKDPWRPSRFPKKQRQQKRKTNDVTDIPGTAASCSHTKYSAFVRVNHDHNPHYQRMKLPPAPPADAAPAADAVPLRRPSSAGASRRSSGRPVRPTSAPASRSMAAIRADEGLREDISSVRALK
eukprot:TRINITY_DN22965_c0_g1_i1.p1 TRINITY_DN22965_c0_g1~~TRINITY_DN22965_c0_g1_i1.p1  ORF type:complete len:353 (+),score=65.44 TRINITY_DN22965_c0_g1_i1:70-1128(+)